MCIAWCLFITSLQGMPQRQRSKKHISVRKRDDFHDKYVSRKDAQHMVNAWVDEGKCPDMDAALRVLQDMNFREGKDRDIVLCSHCARKIGVKYCSGCADSQSAWVSYCSTECQAAAWPSHKALCGKPVEKEDEAAVDVD